VLLVAGAIAAWVFYDGQRMMRADLTVMKARYEIGGWLGGSSTPPTDPAWKAARDAVRAASAITPDDASLHELMGDLYTVIGRRDAADEALRVQHFGQAVTHYQQAIRLRPSDGMLHAVLAWAHYGAGQTDGRFLDAWARALELGPHEGAVQQLLFELAMANWTVATPGMQRWVETLYAQAKPAQRTAMENLGKKVGVVLTAPATPAVSASAIDLTSPAAGPTRAAGAPAATPQ
jgi:tetratricopeptide (TPR) repeat protein